MNIEKTWLWGGTGAVVGLLIGIAIAGDGREAREAEARGQKAIESGLASVSDTVGKMDQSLANLSGRVTEIETSLKSVSEQGTGVQALSQRLDQVGVDLQGAVHDLGGAVSDLGTSVTKSLTERMEGLRTVLAGAGARMTGDGGQAPVEEAAAPAGEGAGELVAMGSTVIFADGAVRVFLSGTNPEGGTARVALNGPVASEVALGQPAEVGDCSVTLTGFAETGATFDVGCGAEAASGEHTGSGAAVASAAGAATGAATGAGTPIAIGAAETLVDGKLRVFLSAVDAEAGTARVAINGPKAVSVSMGVPVEAAGCSVTLTGIGDAQATIDGSC